MNRSEAIARATELGYRKIRKKGDDRPDFFTITMAHILPDCDDVTIEGDQMVFHLKEGDQKYLLMK